MLLKAFKFDLPTFQLLKYIYQQWQISTPVPATIYEEVIQQTVYSSQWKAWVIWQQPSQWLGTSRRKFQNTFHRSL